MHGIHTGSLVASMSGPIPFAQPGGPSIEGLHDIVHFCVDCIFNFSDATVLHGVDWWWGLFARDCRKVRHYWQLWEQNSSWN